MTGNEIKRMIILKDKSTIPPTEVSICSKSLYLTLASLRMSGFSFCPISNTKLFLGMCGHKSNPENNREEDKERERESTVQ